MSEALVTLREGIPPEDQARADFYALLARLFADAPDAAFLAAVANAASLVAEGSLADGGGQDLAAAWDELRAASARVDPVSAADEHQALFVGVGRSAVSPYASHYLAPQSGRLLAELRATLARLGLARKPAASEYEDHIAVVLETMRLLAAGDATTPPASISGQREFFERYVAPWAFDCCAAIATNSVANYYRPVAQFAASFLALERDSFALE